MFAKAARAGLQSGTIMCVADTITQLGVEGKTLSSSSGQRPQDATNNPTSYYDPYRSLRWAVAGLTLHGPYFFLGFSRVDAYFGAAATHWVTVAKKTAVAQFVLFPPYLIALFTYIGWMEGTAEIAEKVKTKVPDAFLGGCIYWPIANGLNFALVPSTVRVPYLAVSAGVWNCYLSWTNARVNRTSQAKFGVMTT